MNFLSPAKLLVILVVALAVLGPDKLPTLAKQVGNLWRDFSRLRQKLESDVRGSFPDLPSTETITHAVRSPLSFLGALAEPSPEAGGTGSGDPSTTGSAPGSLGGSSGAVTPAEFGGSDSQWPAETVIGSAGEVNESPATELLTPEVRTTPILVLVDQDAGIVHEVRPGRGATPDDPASN